MNNKPIPKPSSKKTVIIIGVLFCICCCIISIVSGGGIFFMTRKKDKKKDEDEDDPSPSPSPSDTPSPTPSPSNIPSPPVKISAGTSVKCSANELRGNDNSVYRSMEDGTLAHYPNPEIASSWNPNWSENIMEVDCEGFTKGEDVKMKSYFDEGVDYSIKGSRDGKYCANDSDTGMICNRTVASDWEKFQFIYQGDNKYAIKSNRTNKQCKDNRGSVSKCDTDHIQQHEKFVIEKHGDKYSIKGGWGNKYCSDQSVGLICDTGHLQDWEKFTIKKIN